MELVNLFYYKSKFKISIWRRGGGGGGGAARVSVFFLH